MTSGINNSRHRPSSTGGVARSAGVVAQDIVLKQPPRLRDFGSLTRHFLDRAATPPVRPVAERQFLLARFQRAFLQGFTRPSGWLRLAHRGLLSFTPPACKPAARKGCKDMSPGFREAIAGVIASH